MDLTPIFQNSLSPDGEARKQAEAQLKKMEQENLTLFMGLLCQELMTEQKPPETRQAAGLYLKNLLDSKDDARKEEYHQRWIQLDPTTKNQIKQAVLQTLSSTNLHAAKVSAQVVSKIGLIELARKEWQDLVQTLLSNVAVNNTNLKISSLEALGFICDDIDPLVLGAQSNQILTAVIQGMRKEEPELSVRVAATRSLNNAMIFIKRNFESKEERDFIMQTVCEACVSQGDADAVAPLKQQAFECLVRAGDLYYDYLGDYMQAIAQLSFGAIKSEPEDVGRMAIEFWCTICDEEIDLISDAELAAEENTQADRRCLGFIAAALPTLTPLLLEKLTTLEDDDDDDNISTSAGTCLTLIANTARDEAVPHVLPFVEPNLGSTEWKLRASAILAFGFLLEGPSKEKLQPLVVQVIPLLINLLQGQDQITKVKDSAAWTISRVCEFHGRALETCLPQVFTGLLVALKDEPRIANNACWAIHFIALEFGSTEESQPTNALSQFFQGIIQGLLICTERDDLDEANLRIASYEVINTVISAGADDTLDMSSQLIQGLLQRLMQTFQVQVLTSEDRAEQSELQGLLCGVFSSLTNKLGARIQPFVEPMMQMFLQVFSQQEASVHEEALMAVSAVATVIGDGFKAYAEPIMPVLRIGLSNHKEYEVCSVAVGLVGDMCRALERDFAHFSDEVLTILMGNLQNPELDNSVKPAILGVLGDIAMAVGGTFEKYLGPVMTLLYQVSMLEFDPNDEDMVEYMNEIRESVFEAYVGIVQGMSEDKKQDVMVGFLEGMFGSIRMAAQEMNRDTAVTRSAVSLVGDLCTIFGPQCALYVADQTIQGLVVQALQEGVEDAQYAKDAMSACTQQG